ncbi:LacI family DNA-binding transcriptional regulator [Psychromicrobium xiongbiense]|uniref:LacI family DNA-binding transcriptional regulator n=1 Tax=Psychromicrobium xiongbiense TaxID=3051184 RepID=UPI00255364C6|nr:LacI family DNA-binding transcriptional regulator [Psychromicrobium sp. YIM S02556]
MAVSIEDVAAAAGVSTATVSRAIRGLPRVSPQTRERVLRLAGEMGYVASSAASGLATGRTRTLGVLAPYVSRWFFAKAIEGVDVELHAQNYNLMLINLGGYGTSRLRIFENTMLRKQIDGLVVLCLALHPSELEQLHQAEIPVLALGGPVEGLSQVCIDDYAAACLAAEHLVELGHRRIVQIHGQAADAQNFAVPALRRTAFEDTFRRAGLEMNPEWSSEGDFSIDGGLQMARKLFDLPVFAEPGQAPTAVVCASDEMALGVMYEAQRRGIRIPEDLSVVGIDDHEFAGPAGLTTVRQDPVAQGRTAAAMLLSELHGVTDAIQTVAAPYSLVVRESTAPPSS